MKISKTTQGSVTVNIDSEKLAEAIGKAVARELAPLLNNQTTHIMHGTGTPFSLTNQVDSEGNVIEIDERVVDVGVSTQGIEMGDDKPLAKETTKDDNVSKSTSKLKALLGLGKKK